MILATLFNYFVLAQATGAEAATGSTAPAAGGGLAEQFGVNGPAFLAQLIVFTIIFLILKKFAFGPITDVLEQRRRKIEQSMADADRIKTQLAEAEVRQTEILNQAHAQAKKLLEEAKMSSAALADRKTQEAIREAEQIITKASAATNAERAKMFAELKAELGALVIDTTTLVTGKVLTDADKQRLNSEISRDLAAAKA